jgi:hypothetical protein
MLGYIGDVSPKINNEKIVRENSEVVMKFTQVYGCKPGTISVIAFI